MMMDVLCAAAAIALLAPADDMNPELAGSSSSTAFRQSVLEWTGNEVPLLTVAKIEAVCTAELERIPTHNGNGRAEYLLRRGIARYYLGKRSESAKDLREALSLSPDSVVVKEWLGIVLSERRNTAHEASQIAAELLNEYPKRCTGYCIQGMLAMNQRRFHEAEQRFSSAIECEPERQSLYLARAICNYKLEKKATFLRDIATARSKVPSLGSMRAPIDLIYAVALFQNGRASEAVDVLLAARAKGQNDKVTLANIWICCGWVRKPAWCLLIGKEMVDDDPRDPFALRTYARALGENGSPREGLAYLKRAEHLLLKKPAYLSTEMGCLSEMLGRYEDACKFYELALRKFPDRPETILRYSLLLATCPVAELRNGPRAKAMVHTCLERLRLPESRRLGMMVLAAAQAECGEFDQGMTTLDNAVKVRSFGPPADEVLMRFRKLLESGAKVAKTSDRSDSFPRIPSTVIILEGAGNREHPRPDISLYNYAMTEKD